MSACGPWCGHCGRCSGAWEHQRPQKAYYPMCDKCGKQIYVGAKTLAGVGTACSDKCLNALCVQHENALSKR